MAVEKDIISISSVWVTLHLSICDRNFKIVLFVLFVNYQWSLVIYFGSSLYIKWISLVVLCVFVWSFSAKLCILIICFSRIRYRTLTLRSFFPAYFKIHTAVSLSLTGQGNLFFLLAFLVPLVCYWLLKLIKDRYD